MITASACGEAIEQAPRGPIETLEAVGSGWFTRIGYGYWPQVKPTFWLIVLLRWDINVRESMVLGLVGAGGIGMMLDTAMNLFQRNRVATDLLAVFAVVVVVEVVLRIFLRVIAQSLQDHSPGAASANRATLHISAIAFIHRFGSSLNGHVHFHVCAFDGVFEEVAGDQCTTLQRALVADSFHCAVDGQPENLIVVLV